MTISEKVKLVLGLNKIENISKFLCFLFVSFHEYWLQRHQEF